VVSSCRMPIVSVLLLALLSPLPAAGDWKEAHKLGVEAIENGRFDDAERFFRAAIGERAEERVNRLLKVSYLPHYNLGVALAEQEKCRPAIDSWQESSRQGQIKKSKLEGDLNRRLETCRNHLRQVDTASSEVEQLIESVVTAANLLESLADAPELRPQWHQGNPSFESRQEDAMQSLAEARRFLTEGRARDDLDRLGSAKTRANQALSDFDATVSAARQRLGEVGAATASALQDLKEVENEAQRTLKSIADLAPYPRRLGSRVATVQRKLSEITDQQTGAGTERLDALRNELAAALASLKRSARRPPVVLRQAVEAFFGNRFQEVLDLTEETDFRRNKAARSHLCLLRSASRHSLWILGGQSDEQLLSLATAEIETCSEIEPPLLPSPKFFSPRFVEFHTESRADVARDAEAGSVENTSMETVPGQAGIAGGGAGPGAESRASAAPLSEASGDTSSDHQN